MTGLQVFGVVLIALGIAYGVLYAGWLWLARRRRAADALEASRPTRAATVETLSAEGTYLGTTRIRSGTSSPVTALGPKSKATLKVRRASVEDLLTIERVGVEPLVIAADRLGSVRTVRSRGRHDRALAVSWKGPAGEAYLTTFTPRLRADLDRLESSLWWHAGGTDVRILVGQSPVGGPTTEDEPAAEDEPATEHEPAAKDGPSADHDADPGADHDADPGADHDADPGDDTTHPSDTEPEPAPPNKKGRRP